jgi:hypothetical protein
MSDTKTSRTTIIVVSLLSAIFGLIYVLMNYYGWTRYLALQTYPTSSYIEGYKKLQKADTKNKVIVSFTSTPDRIKRSLAPFINSLLDQTVSVDEIAITVPYGESYNLPKYLKPIVTDYRYSKPYGCLGSLIPVIMRERDANTKIIIVSDKHIYGKDFIQDLVEASDKEPNSIIFADLKNGEKGVLVKPLFFKPEMCSDMSCSDSTDLWGDWIDRNISIGCLKSGIG